jgi:hypothetical protein
MDNIYFYFNNLKNNYMQIVNTTIVTSVTEIKELIQHCIVHNLEGQINLTFEDGKILVSEPSKEPAPDDIG